MSDKHETFENSFVNSIKSDNLKSLKPKPFLDEFMTDGVGSDIPILGFMYRTYQSVLSIRDALFAQKVYRFLFELQDVPIQDRIKFLSQFETDEDLAEFGSTVMLQLESYTHLQKANILSKITRAYMLDLINRETFDTLSHSLESITMSDLNYLFQLIHKKKDDITLKLPQTFGEELTQSRLSNAGLLSSGELAEYYDSKEDDRLVRGRNPHISLYGYTLHKICTNSLGEK